MPTTAPDPPQEQPPTLALHRKVLFAVITVCVLLLAIEGVFRLSEKTPRYMPSDVLGYELRPGYDREHRRYRETARV